MKAQINKNLRARLWHYGGKRCCATSTRDGNGAKTHAWLKRRVPGAREFHFALNAGQEPPWQSPHPCG